MALLISQGLRAPSSKKTEETQLKEEKPTSKKIPNP